MHKADLTYRLINEMVDHFPQLTDVLMKESVDALVETIINTLVLGGKMEIRGFGSFYLRYYPERQSRNPKTAEIIKMTSRHRLFFKAAKKLKLRLNASGR
jgi:integration host factor subunit beta